MTTKDRGCIWWWLYLPSWLGQEDLSWRHRSLLLSPETSSADPWRFCNHSINVLLSFWVRKTQDFVWYFIVCEFGFDVRKIEFFRAMYCIHGLVSNYIQNLESTDEIFNCVVFNQKWWYCFSVEFSFHILLQINF